MRKLILCSVIAVLLSAWGFAQTAYQAGQVGTSLSAVAATGAGTTFALPMRDGKYPSVFTWTNVYTGTPSAITVNFEGSIDNVTFFTLDSSTNTAGEMKSVANKPVRFVRCNISAYTVNASTATCKFIASNL